MRTETTNGRNTMETQKLNQGSKYPDWKNLQFAIWSTGAVDIPGYGVEHYFSDDNDYYGPDFDGIEPLFLLRISPLTGEETMADTETKGKAEEYYPCWHCDGLGTIEDEHHGDTTCSFCDGTGQTPEVEDEHHD